MDFKDPIYEKLLAAQLMVHMAASPDRLRPMIEAQIARDEAMSAVLADYLRSAAGAVARPSSFAARDMSPTVSAHRNASAAAWATGTTGSSCWPSVATSASQRRKRLSLDRWKSPMNSCGKSGDPSPTICKSPARAESSQLRFPLAEVILRSILTALIRPGRATRNATRRPVGGPTYPAGRQSRTRGNRARQFPCGPGRSAA